MRRRHREYLLWGVPAAIGTGGLLIAAVLARQDLAFQREAVRAEGRVVGLERRCRQDGCSEYPVVEFAAPRPVRITGGFGWPEGSHAMGERLDVLYPATSPEAARIDHWVERWLGTVIALAIGGGFGLVGFPSVALQVRRDLRRRWALRHGSVVSARVIDVRRWRFSNNLGFRLVAEWQNPRDGKLHRFTSDPVSLHPGTYLQGRTHVDVRLDPAAPDRYWIDTRFMPDTAT